MLIAGVVGLMTARGLFHHFGDMPGMLMTALTSLLASPISWGHYWVWIVPAITWSAYEVWRSRTRAGTVLIIASAVLFFAYPARIDPATGGWNGRVELLPKGFLWAVPQSDKREYSWNVEQQVLGNMYVVFGIVIFTIAVAWFGSVHYRNRRRAPSTVRHPHGVGGDSRAKPRPRVVPQPTDTRR
jgi:alpha-1,2-mannosyltransferase